ncbi:aryl hydrocarbon receptor nuclear translocator homolog [Drosophila tropicalis]|uniref:aryl hydrocarbon receptor nuclear translocator homolog n=1 Tax=Drosophila tropicalis TaxID=46794 RepID=UPI0035ABA121
MAAAETTTATASASATASVGADVAVMATTTTTTGTSTAAAAAAAAAAAEAANGREARNLAEKQRRDKLNASIQELATMVPHAAESTRRLDKTAVLRFATHGLRLQYVFGKSALRRRRKLGLKGSTSSHETNPLLTDTLMQLLDSFFITLTCNGQIVLVSSSVEQLLGHCQSDLYGQNLLQITHPDDQALLRQQLIPRDIETLFYQQQQHQQQQHTLASTSTSGSDDDDNVDEEMEEDQQQHVNQLEPSGVHPPSPRTIAHLAAIDERLRSDRRCFSVRLSRASTRAESTRHYELVKIDGCFRRSDSSLTGGAAANYPIVSQLIRRSRNNNMLAAAAAAAAAAANTNATPTTATIPPCLPQHDAIAQAALHGISGNDIVLVAMARIIREDPEVDDTSAPNATPHLYTPLSLLYRQPEPYQLEYKTRHLIDGSIIDCDQRIGIVAGYMKDEVRNLSPFCFMHLDDVRWVIVALRQMYDCNSDYGESCYRLLSRNGRFIYLQTKGFLEIDKSTNKVHSFLCVNTLLDEQSGKRKVQEMKNKFSTIIKADIPTHTSPDLPASKAPQQLERIVLYLIENLQKSAAGQQQQQHQQQQHHQQQNQRQSSVEPMEIMDDGYSSPASTATTLTLEELSPSPLPPQLALVPPAPSSVKHSITQSVNVVNTAARNLQYNQHESIQLSPVASPSSNPCPSPQGGSPSPPSSAPERPSVLKKSPPNQLHAALTSTLRCLDNKLSTLDEEVQSLYQQQQEQRSTLLPKLEQQMDAIMLEHQKQKQILVNIQSEYDDATALPQSLPHPSHPHPHPVKPQAVSVITTATTNSSTTNRSSNRNTNGTTSQQMKQQRRVL